MAKTTKKEEERILEVVCGAAKTLGEEWYEENKDKYSDDLYKAWRYLQDVYFEENNILEMVLARIDEKNIKKLFKYLDEDIMFFKNKDERYKQFRRFLEEYFVVDEIFDAA